MRINRSFFIFKLFGLNCSKNHQSFHCVFNGDESSNIHYDISSSNISKMNIHNERIRLNEENFNIESSDKLFKNDEKLYGDILKGGSSDYTENPLLNIRNNISDSSYILEREEKIATTFSLENRDDNDFLAPGIPNNNIHNYPNNHEKTTKVSNNDVKNYNLCSFNTYVGLPTHSENNIDSMPFLSNDFVKCDCDVFPTLENIDTSYKDNFDFLNSANNDSRISKINDSFYTYDQNISYLNLSNNIIHIGDNFPTAEIINDKIVPHSINNTDENVINTYETSSTPKIDKNDCFQDNIEGEMFFIKTSLQISENYPFDTEISNKNKNNINPCLFDENTPEDIGLKFIANDNLNTNYNNIIYYDNYPKIQAGEKYLSLSTTPLISLERKPQTSFNHYNFFSDKIISKHDELQNKDVQEATVSQNINRYYQKTNIRKRNKNSEKIDSSIKNGKKVSPEKFQPKLTNKIGFKKKPESKLVENKISSDLDFLKCMVLFKNSGIKKTKYIPIAKILKLNQKNLKYEINSDKYIKNLDIFKNILLIDGFETLKHIRWFKSDDCDINEFKKRTDFLSMTKNIISETIPYLANIYDLYIEDIFEMFLVFDPFLHHGFLESKPYKSYLDINETDVNFLSEYFDDIRKNKIFTGIFIEFFAFDLEKFNYTFKCVNSSLDLETFLSFHFSFQVLKILLNEKTRPRLTYDNDNNLRLLAIYKIRIREKILSLSDFFWITERAIIYREIANSESYFTHRIFGFNFQTKKEKTLYDLKEFLFARNTHTRMFILFFIVPIEENKLLEVMNEFLCKECLEKKFETKNLNDTNRIISTNSHFIAIYFLKELRYSEKIFYRNSRIYLPFLLSVNILIDKIKILNNLSFIKVDDSEFNSLPFRNISRIVQSLNRPNFSFKKHKSENIENRNLYKALVSDFLKNSLKTVDIDLYNVSDDQLAFDRAKLMSESMSVLKNFSLEKFLEAINFEK